MTPHQERRRDFWFKVASLALYAVIGAASAWAAIEIGQARLEERMKAVEERTDSMLLKVDRLEVAKVSRQENDAADAAQDRRIDDIKTELDSIHADIRTLLVVQARN
jgi:coenzyme F420-reducing hydrogenase delta subunit